MFLFILFLCLSGVKSESEDIIHQYFEKIQNAFAETNNTCAVDVLHTIEAFRKGEAWPLRMFDASSKLQSGVMLGNLVNFGSFDECLAINTKVKDRVIKGKYCMLLLFFTTFPRPNITYGLVRNVQKAFMENQGLPIVESICIPNSCKVEDLFHAFSKTEIYNVTKINPWFSEGYCQVNDINIKHEFTPWHALFLLVIGAHVILLILCTTYDIYLQKNEKKPFHKIMISYSLYTNFKQLIKINKDPDQLPCINGIRALSMAWIILGHRFLFVALFPHINYLYTFEWVKETSSSFITGSIVAVDTFFLISGLLVMYILLLANSKNVRFNFFYYYLHRILRIFPAFLILILFYMTYIKDLSTGLGPMSPLAYETMIQTCQKNWWYSVLSIQNILASPDICVSQSWYLAVDTQLYAVAPFLFLPILKWPKPTLIVMCALVIVSNVYSFIKAWNWKLSASYLAIGGQFNVIYSSTLARSCDWIIGSLLGYYLFIKRGEKIIIRKIVVIVLWIISITGTSTVIFLQVYYNNSDYNRITSSMYHGFSKTLWCTSLAWIIFACVHGYSGFINKFLSNRLFAIIGRVSYSMYLTHVMVIYFNVANYKIPTTFSNSDVLYFYWADLVYTFLLSTIWCLCFESPVMAIGKIFLPANVKQLKKCNEENETQYYNNQLTNLEYSTRL